MEPQPLENKFSHLTAIKRNEPSFPTRWLLKADLLKGRVLDFGCGYGVDGDFLYHEGFDISEFDPHYKPVMPDGKFDTILCHYVLNVLLPIEQANVLMDVSEKLSPKGKAFFAVRRDLQQEGFRTHAIYKQPTYQCSVKLPYRSLVRNKFCEIYEYTPFTFTEECKAFHNIIGDEYEHLTETATVFAVKKSENEAFIVPKRPVSSFFALTQKEQTALWLVTARVRQLLGSQNLSYHLAEGNGAIRVSR